MPQWGRRTDHVRTTAWKYLLSTPRSENFGAKDHPIRILLIVHEHRLWSLRLEVPHLSIVPQNVRLTDHLLSLGEQGHNVFPVGSWFDRCLSRSRKTKEVRDRDDWLFHHVGGGGGPSYHQFPIVTKIHLEKHHNPIWSIDAPNNR